MHRTVVLLFLCSLLFSCAKSGMMYALCCMREKLVTYDIGHLDTWEDIHLFQVFDSNIDSTDVDDIAKYYDFVWGATVKNVKEYARVSNITLSKYLPFSRDPDDTHSFTYWNQIHPDWIIYQCDRVRFRTNHISYTYIFYRGHHSHYLGTPT